MVEAQTQQLNNSRDSTDEDRQQQAAGGWQETRRHGTQRAKREAQSAKTSGQRAAGGWQEAKGNAESENRRIGEMVKRGPGEPGAGSRGGN